MDKAMQFANQPLAERLRPATLSDFIGQEHLIGEGAVLRKMIESGKISSFLLWGPPGGWENDPCQDYSQYAQPSVSHLKRHQFRSKGCP